MYVLQVMDLRLLLLQSSEEEATKERCWRWTISMFRGYIYYICSVFPPRSFSLSHMKPFLASPNAVCCSFISFFVFSPWARVPSPAHKDTLLVVPPMVLNSSKRLFQMPFPCWGLVHHQPWLAKTCNNVLDSSQIIYT